MRGILANNPEMFQLIFGCMNIGFVAFVVLLTTIVHSYFKERRRTREQLDRDYTMPRHGHKG